MHVSLITSLYRTEDHIQNYVDHAVRVANEAKAQGIDVEFVVVANDATQFEREQIARFQAVWSYVKTLFVPRESLYISWNRGVDASSGETVGTWNVDDVRTVEALVQGYAKLQQGCKLVYFAHDVVRTVGDKITHHHYPAVPYDREFFRKVYKCGPFFMYRREVFDELGGFDDRFLIAGDVDYVVKASYHFDLCPVPVVAGTFYLHGDNLSDSGNPLQIAETNMIYLIYHNEQYITPCDPVVMKKTWQIWADEVPLTPEQEDFFWGEGAEQRYQDWLRKEIRRKRIKSIKRIYYKTGRRVIDALGLRALLSKMGLVSARKTLGSQQ